MVKAERLIASMPPETWARLETLASERFHGNRSLAVAWAVDMAFEVLTAPAMRERLFGTPQAALAAWLETER